MVTLYRFGKEAFPESEFGSIASRGIQVGLLGVNLFFVLSGYLITRILLHSIERPDYFRSFYSRRTLRIFPLYFLSLVLFLHLAPAVSMSPTIFSEARENAGYLWTYTTNLKMSWDAAWSFGYLDHFWSLAVEEQFYLLWPFFVLLTGRHLLKVALAGAFLGGLARSWFCLISNNTVAPDVFTFFQCDGLLLGASVAAFFNPSTEPTTWLPRLYWVTTWCVLTFIALVATQGRFFELPILLINLAFASGLAIVLLQSDRSRLRRLLSNRSLRSFGKYSYAMYVFQSPLIPLVAMTIAWLGWPALNEWTVIGRCFYVLGMTAVTWSIGLISWNAFEVHFIRLRRP